MLNSSSNTIHDNDQVILWLTKDQLSLIRVEKDKLFQNKFGSFRHADMIGRNFGDKLSSTNNRGFIHLLKPSAELWTLALPHRTQILYNTDISFIMTTLNIKPGSRVIESGTGSGSFSHSVARTIGKRGQLHSFEYHQSRSEKARLEFSDHGLSDIISVYHRDSCKDGFTSELHNSIDSVFLDLPMPWLAIPHAKQALRKDKTSRICCFSPCIEQVLKTITSLNANGFTNVTMYEVLTKNYDTSYTHLPTVTDATHKLKAVLHKKETRRQQQIAASQKKLEEKTGESAQVEEAEEVKQTEQTEQTEKTEQTKSPERAERPQRNQNKRKLGAAQEASNASNANNANDANDADDTSASASASTRLLSRPFMDTRGHTSYLTFASLLPDLCDSATDKEEKAETDEGVVDKMLE
ncbi:hypothetical protein E3P99_01535 [Wallemia hederae]|uniref:tRNA (adenine(58)-N(1))-methyltransferase catalytic subunit TRM61 n=1 Tax=Wallemia hederae TaxID=1540922 RepID=A0A4T0FRJ3_9BASI|nr:hypothetical protein E3P99_01535 [Wallemia hederae]